MLDKSMLPQHNQSYAVAEIKNKVLRNTYALLSVTVMFSALVAYASAVNGWSHPGIILTLVGYFGLLFLVYKTRNSAAGIASVFALTGFMGYTLGPIVGAYWSMGPAIVMQALTGTAVVFFGMSAYALTTKRDFSFLRGFLVVGVILAFVGSLAAVLLQIPALSLAISAMVVLLMSGLILFETKNIVDGGETNYIMATTSLFVAVFNLFTSLLHLIGFTQSE